MRTTIASVIVTLGLVSAPLRSIAQSRPASRGSFPEMLSPLIQVEGADYEAARRQILAMGKGIQGELQRIVASDQSAWQERALGHALLARIAPSPRPHGLNELEGILRTGVLPRWARPLKVEYGRDHLSRVNRDRLPEEAFEPAGSPMYFAAIGRRVTFDPDWADLTIELLWKGLIPLAECRQSVLTSLADREHRGDHQLAVGVAQAVFNRAEDLKTQEAAVWVLAGHVGPARQKGRAVKDSAEVITWLTNIARDSARDRGLRSAALQAMGATAEPAAVAPVLEFLRADDASIRSGAIQGAGSLLSGYGYPNPGRASLVEALEALLSAPDTPSTLAREATNALLNVDRRADPAAARRAADALDTYLNRTRPADRRPLQERISYLRAQTDGPPASKPLR